MGYTQDERLIAVHTPLGKDVLLLQGFSGEEGISRPFGFHLDLLSENSSISFDDIVGQRATISSGKPVLASNALSMALLAASLKQGAMSDSRIIRLSSSRGFGC